MPTADIVGLIRVNDHCLFTWRGPPPEARKRGVPERSVELSNEHCKLCVEEVVMRLGFGTIDCRGPAPGRRPSGRSSDVTGRLALDVLAWMTKHVDKYREASGSWSEMLLDIGGPPGVTAADLHEAAARLHEAGAIHLSAQGDEFSATVR